MSSKDPNDKGNEAGVDEKPKSDDHALTLPEQQHPPQNVGFLQLFRFATRFDVFLNFIGLITAALAGAALPLMSLAFGKLTNQFVNFGTLVAETHGNFSDPAVRDAGREFRRNASSDAAILTYLGLGTLVTTYIYMSTWVYTGEVLSKRTREQYLRAVLRQDIAFFDNVGAGEVATRIQTDTHLIQQATSEKVAIVASSIATFFTGFILAYIRSWRLALALSSVLPCFILAGGAVSIFVTKYSQLGRTAIADSGTLAEEVIATIRTAQAFGTQSQLSTLYDGDVQKAFVADLKSAIVQGIGIGATMFILYAPYALAFSFGTTLILEGHANAGTVFNVFFAILMGSASINLMAAELQPIYRGIGAAAKIFATIDRVPTIDSASPDGLRPDAVEGRVELDHVDFSYPSRPNVPIVKGLSLTFEAGKTAALVGASGSGKSTIVSLVERFYDPLSGVVKLDGRDLRELNVKWLRSQIGLVSQEPILFATTIAGNVSHGLIGTQWEHASAEEKQRLVKEACVKANADGFISKLPDGYETLVGERGFLLSGGQKQRIAIARAIVSDPKILLLDEATSALDTQSEGLVQNALDKAAAGRTTITIAHRLSTIKNADCIFVMDSGVVVEHGKHEELLTHEDGPYSRLVQAQELRERDEKDQDESQDDSIKGVDATVAEKEALEKEAQEEVPLGRRETGSRSLASEVLEKRRAEDTDGEMSHGMFYLFKRLSMLNRDMWSMYFLGSIAATVNGMIYPVYGIAFASIIDAFQQPSNHAKRVQGDRAALWMFIIAIVAGLSTGFQYYFFGNAASKLVYKLRSLSFKAILRQDIEFFDQERNTTGSLTSSLSENPQKVSGLAGVTLGTIVQSSVTLIGGYIMGLAFGWKLALVGIACTPFVIASGYIRLHVVVMKDEKNRVAHEASAQIACEAAAAIRTVASLTREDDCCQLYSDSLLVPLRQSNRTSLYSNLLFAFSQAAPLFVMSLVFWYGLGLIVTGEYNSRQFYICLIAVTFGSMQAGGIFAFVPDISSARGAGNSIMNLLDSTPIIDAESAEGSVPTDVQGHIRFEDVHFRYPTRPGVRVLRDFNLDVKPGTYIALVGASGSGKSTVIQLIERFYDPLIGRVLLDGQPISDLNVAEYRKHLALVSQEPTLYAGTVRFNILLGATKPVEEVTQEETERACRDANILSFIQSLPDGFETEVGGKGSQLSGGQKQRIAIARALLRNPKVLLLDEATSALDSTSEKVVQEALDQAARGRTTIAIAHRLSSIQNADKIYFIKDGKVSESGTHSQLIAQQGAYYEYVQLQALNRK